MKRKKFLYLDDKWTIEVASYQDNGNLALIIGCKDGDDVPTVNLGSDIGNGTKMPKFAAFLDVNNCPHIDEVFEKAGIAKPYMRFGEPVTADSGFVTYPLYQFDEAILREYDPKGVEEYIRSEG